MYPLPSQTYQMDWDCYCAPIDLIDDTTAESIPQPWQDAVPFFAAYLAFMELQNLNFAKYYETEFDKFIQRYSGYARVSRAVNPYGRYLWYAAFTPAMLEFLRSLGAAVLS